MDLDQETTVSRSNEELKTVSRPEDDGAVRTSTGLQDENSRAEDDALMADVGQNAKDVSPSDDGKPAADESSAAPAEEQVVQSDAASQVTQRHV